MIVKWCCTAGACLLGLQWEKTQQRGYLGPQSQDGSPQRSAVPAIQGHPPPCSPHFAGTYTWNYAGHSVFSAGTSPPANSRKLHVSVVSVADLAVRDVPYLTRWSKTLKASRARSGYWRISARAWPMREEGLLSLTSLPISMYPGRNRNTRKINETSQPNQSVSQSVNSGTYLDLFYAIK